MLLKISLFLCCLISFFAQAQVLPGDVPYRVYETEKYHLIFPEDYRSWVGNVKNLQDKLQENYEKSYAWTLDERTDFVLASNQNQIANAYATVYYNNSAVFYNGGASLLDSFATRSWLVTLMTHEGAHLYQLNPKEGPSSFLHRYLGNSLTPHLFYILPIFVSPNALLPTWLLEGNSVLNESRFSNGGRLYSGEEKALFYSLVRSGKLKESRLTNDHLDFPYGHEKYNVGAEFALFLAKRYGVEQANRFFTQHAEHYINPFLLNRSFIRHFGISYTQAIREFLDESSKEAKGQKVSISPRLIEAPFIGDLNQDEEKIFFVSGDGKLGNKLYLYNKRSRLLSSKSLDLPLGKVFENEKDHFYSVESDFVSYREIKFSLWDSEGRDLSEYRGKILLDKRGKDKLWFDPSLSFDEAALFFNDGFYDYANSSALFDPQGHIYYFKQKGKVRTLLRDKKPLFSFEGHYGKLLEIDEKGIPYFIASTKYGSSLFAYKEGKIFRLLDSDVIVDARRIKEGDFLVKEIGRDSYELKVLRTTFSQERPALYQYPLAQETLTASQAAPVSLPQREYSLIRDLRFSGINFMGTYGGSALSANLSALWADGLGQNNISLSYSRDEWNGEDRLQTQYLNKKNIIAWYLRYLREEKYEGKDNEHPGRDEHDDKPSLGGLYPFLKAGLWGANLETSVSYSTERSAWINYSALQVLRTKNHSLEFNPYRSLNFLLENEIGDDEVRTSAASLETHMGLAHGFFIHAFGLYKESSDDEMTLDKAINEISSGVLTRGYSLYGDKRHTLKGGRLSFEVGQFFEGSHYFASFPLSLRRVAPKLIFNHYYYQGLRHGDFQERGVALETELLLVHLLPFRASFATLRKEKDSAEFLFSLGTQASF